MTANFETRFLALLVPILLFAAPASGEDKPDSKVTKRYESPKAVFDAYRAAYGKGDARTLFSVRTTNRQNNIVFECFFACMEAGGKEGTEERGEILGKYLDAATLSDEYEK